MNAVGPAEKASEVIGLEALLNEPQPPCEAWDDVDEHGQPKDFCGKPSVARVQMQCGACGVKECGFVCAKHLVWMSQFGNPMNPPMSCNRCAATACVYWAVI